MRIRQEILLGIGGYRALEALGMKPTVYHMNEGHSAFLGIERVLRLMETGKLTFSEARVLASASLVFTTHTPVAAGHDYYPPFLMDRYFSEFMRRLGISRSEFLGLGRQDPANESEDFCMTVLALRLASHQQRREQAARRSFAADVESRLERCPGVGSSHRSRHQRRALPKLGFPRNESALRPLSRPQMARGARRRKTLATHRIDSRRGIVENTREAQGAAGGLRAAQAARAIDFSRRPQVGGRVCR